MPNIKQIRIIAPSSAPLNTTDLPGILEKIKNFLHGWGVEAKITENIFGKDENFPSFANTDEQRFAELKNALNDPDVDVIWCLRGGYGVIRLLPELQKMAKPSKPKLVIGFSDITLLLIFLQQEWGWDVIHGPVAFQGAFAKVSSEDLEKLRDLIFGNISSISIEDLTPINKVAEQAQEINASIIGGNLTLISRIFGTSFQMNCAGKILLLEDVGEPFRKVDGIFEQFFLQKNFEDNLPAAVIIGDISADKPEEIPEINASIQRFAAKLAGKNIPVLHCLNIGHGKSNHPLPMGPKAILKLGDKPQLSVNWVKKNDEKLITSNYPSFKFSSEQTKNVNEEEITTSSIELKK